MTDHARRIERLENCGSPKPRDITLREVIVETVINADGQRQEIIRQGEYEYSDWRPYGNDGSRIRHAKLRSENPDVTKGSKD